MKERIVSMTAAGFSFIALAAALVLYSSGPVRSSDHQDSPTMISRPGADITDVYIFPSPVNDKNVVLAMDVHPLIPAGMGTSTYFDPAVMYQLKIDNRGDRREHLVIQFKAEGAGTNQKITMFGPATPNMIGTDSTFVAPTGTVAYNRVSNIGHGMRMFAGPREDPFFFDLAQFFKIVPDRDFKNHPTTPPPTASCFRKPGIDFLSANRFNVLTLVVEMPRKMLAAPLRDPSLISLWATTSTVTGS